MSGDHIKMPKLPEPKTVIFPPENVQLGWQDEKITVGSGLDNSGVICYINSTLQALFHIPAFTNWLLNDEQHQKMCQQKNGFQKYCTVCMVRDTFMLCQKHTGSSFKASIITDHLTLICKHLSILKQEDAHEFLRYLIDSMERCYLSVLEHTEWSSDNYSKETTPISQILGGYIRTEVKCGECGNVSTTFQHFKDLILDIQSSNTLDCAVDTYFKKEKLDGSYVCEMCQKKVASDKTYFIEKAPNVLCVQLKRYSGGMDGFRQRKNRKAIKINKILDLSNYQFNPNKCKTDARPLRYNLVSMVNHYGTCLNSGHYTALGLTPSGSYYCFNDSRVSQTEYKKFSTSNDSYIVFYELELENKTSTDTSSSSCKLPTKEFSSKKHDKKNGGIKRKFGDEDSGSREIKKKKFSNGPYKKSRCNSALSCMSL